MDLGRAFDVMAEVATARRGPGPAPLSAAEQSAVLDLARVVAHAVERSAAPIACYAVGRIVAQTDASERLALIEALIERIEAEPQAQPSGA